MIIHFKSPDELKILNRANWIVGKVLTAIENKIAPGVTTKELDTLAYQMALEVDAKPAFLNYRGFPASLCVSINEEIVHGIPSARVIQEGDVVSIDFGVEYRGYFGDGARTIIVGENKPAEQLVVSTAEALQKAVENMLPWKYLHDISAAIEEVAKSKNLGIVKDYVGHGIGKKLHEQPNVLNYVDTKQHNIRLFPGMVFAIEPMFTLGSGETKVLDDKWTVVTKDNSLAAHFECSIAIDSANAIVLGERYDF